MLAGVASLLITLPLLAVLAAYLVMATPGGTRWVLEVARGHVDGLTWETVDGTLQAGIEVRGLRWAQEGLEVRVAAGAFDWSPWCLLRGTVCVGGLRIDGFAGRSASVDGPAEVPGIESPVPIEIGAARIRNLSWVVGEPGDAPLFELQEARGALRLQGNRLEFGDLAVLEGGRRYHADGELQLSGDGALRASGTADFGLIGIEGLPSDRPWVVAVDLDGSLQRIGVDAELSGPVPARISGTVMLLSPGLPLEGRIRVDRETRYRLAGEDLRVRRADVRIHGDLDRVSLQGVGTIDFRTMPTVEASFRGEIGVAGAAFTEIDLRVPGAAAEVSWTGPLRWEHGVLAASGSVSMTNLDLAWVDPDVAGRMDGVLGLRGIWSEGEWDFDLDLREARGMVRERPFELRGVARIQNDHRVELRQLAVSSGSARLQASGACVPGCSVTGTAVVPDLGLLDPRLAGSAEGEWKLSGPLARPVVQLSLRGEHAEFTGLYAESLAVNGHVAGLGQADSELHATLSGLRRRQGEALQTLPFDRGRVEVRGTLNEIRLALRASGAQHELDVGAGVRRLAAERGQLDIGLDRLSLDTSGLGNWRLDGAQLWRWTGTHARLVESACLRSDRGSLCAEPGGVVGAGGNLALRMESWRTDAWSAWYPAGFAWEDTLSGNGAVTWDGEGNPGLQLDLAGGPGILRLQSTDPDAPDTGLGYRELRWESAADLAGTRSDLRVESTELGSLRARLELPRGDEKLAGELRVRGLDLQTLRPWFPGIETLEGRLVADVDIAGTRQVPEILGAVRVENGRVSGPALPFDVHGLVIECELEGQRANLLGHFDTAADEALLAEGGTIAGRVRLSGAGRWDQQPWELKLQAEGKEMSLQYGGHTRASVDTSLDLALAPGRLAADAHVEVRNGRIQLPKTAGSAVELSRDVVLDPPEPVPPQRRAIPWEMDTHLSLDLGQKLEFSGLGVDGWLEGRLRMGNLHAEPRAHGRIRVRDGRYRAYGQRLKVRKGELLFTGSPRNPNLNIEAVRPLDQVVAGIRVTGTAEEPVVDLFSDPAMPHEEVLSWLVLGRPLGENSQQEGNLLASSALALGLRGGEGIAGRVAERLGVSQFEVGTAGGQQGTDVFASGYLSPDLFVRYQVGGFTPANSLLLRYRVLPRLFLEATGGIENALDLLYTFEF